MWLIANVLQTLGCIPIASIEAFSESKLGTAGLVEEISTSGGKVSSDLLYLPLTNPRSSRLPTSLLATSLPPSSSVAPTDLFWTRLNEVSMMPCASSGPSSRRSTYSFRYPTYAIVGDSLPVEALLKSKSLSPSRENPRKPPEWIPTSSKPSPSPSKLSHTPSLRFVAPCWSLSDVSQNAGLHPIAIVTDLRNKHASDHKTYGINIKKGAVTCMKEEGVIQPLLVVTSAIRLAAETVAMILKIDDIILVRGF